MCFPYVRSTSWLEPYLLCFDAGRVYKIWRSVVNCVAAARISVSRNERRRATPPHPAEATGYEERRPGPSGAWSRSAQMLGMARRSSARRRSGEAMGNARNASRTWPRFSSTTSPSSSRRRAPFALFGELATCLTTLHERRGPDPCGAAWLLVQ